GRARKCGTRTGAPLLPRLTRVARGRIAAETGPGHPTAPAGTATDRARATSRRPARRRREDRPVSTRRSRAARFGTRVWSWSAPDVSFDNRLDHDLGQR